MLFLIILKLSFQMFSFNVITLIIIIHILLRHQEQFM